MVLSINIGDVLQLGLGLPGIPPVIATALSSESPYTVVYNANTIVGNVPVPAAIEVDAVRFLKLLPRAPAAPPVRDAAQRLIQVGDGVRLFSSLTGGSLSPEAYVVQGYVYIQDDDENPLADGCLVTVPGPGGRTFAWPATNLVVSNPTTKAAQGPVAPPPPPPPPVP